MKKILVLASLAVSLSFGLTEYSHFYTLRFIEYLKAGKMAIGKPCEKVQDKVDGCHIMTERKDGGLDQVVVYQNKKIVSSQRVFNSLYPPMETDWLTCYSPELNPIDKSKKLGKSLCVRHFGGSITSEDKVEQREGDWNEFVKQFVKQ